jgi:hypothetical protein
VREQLLGPRGVVGLNLAGPPTRRVVLVTRDRARVRFNEL